MPLIEKSVLVPFSAAQMYALVEKVEDYPQFLPWCGGSSVRQRSASEMEASIEIRFKGIAQHFATINRLTPVERIDMALKEGPFSDLQGGWHFVAPARRRLQSRIQARLQLLQPSARGPDRAGVHYIASSFVESFTSVPTVYMAAANDLSVTVVHAAAGLELESEKLEVPPGTTLKTALDSSRLAQRVNPFNDKRVGIFGQLCRPEQVLEAGDRIEIYQPLKVDPKEARRRRAEVRGKRRK